MLANIIYFTVFVILVFVLSIAVKAITRGVEAKQTIKENRSLDFKKENENQSQNQSLEIVDQIKELKKLYNEGILSEEEFKKAKDKMLK